MTDLHVACAADERYIGHSAAMLHSVLTHAGGHIVAHYLHGPDFPGDATRKLAAMAKCHGGELAFHTIDSQRISGLPALDRFGLAMWFRIFLPELLPAVERVLYLDVDTIVTDRLVPLWELDLSGTYLAAVTNVSVDAYRHHPQEIGLDPLEYFNSGVLLFNLEVMRQARFAQRIAELVSSHRPLVFPDQDALNLAVQGRWLKLHPRWNSMNSFTTRRPLAVQVFGEQTVREAVRDPAIRHFEGPSLAKPWHLLHDRAGQRLYRQHRRATPWPDYRLEGQTPGNWARRVLTDVRAIARPARDRGRRFNT